MKKSAVIVATGMAVPERIVTNNDLAAMMDTSDEWIQQRSGIKERRFVADDEGPSDLGERAVRNALKQANLQVSDIDFLMVASLSPEHYFPGTSCFMQRKLGMGTTPAMDIRVQCSGFLYALTVAKSMIISGQYRRIAVCGVEVHSRAIDLTTRGRDVSVLFGDGAAAVILEGSDTPDTGVLVSCLHSEGEHAERLWIEAPRSAKAPFLSAQMLEDGTAYPRMDGRFVFKHAVSRIPEVINEALATAQLKLGDIDHFFFHQANLRINEAVATGMGIPMEKTYHNIQKYGNCSAASIPMCMDEVNRSGKLKRDDLVCLAGFGSGFAWGSLILRW